MNVRWYNVRILNDSVEIHKRMKEKKKYLRLIISVVSTFLGDQKFVLFSSKAIPVRKLRNEIMKVSKQMK